MANLSTESIAGAKPPVPAADGQCANCGAPLAGDQRYCLQCGERRVGVSEFLRSGPPGSSPPPASPPAAPGGAAEPPGSRNNLLAVIAGVGVLMLAMGVGVLIGRSGGSGRPALPSVVTLGATGTGTGASAGTGAEPAFSDDWPAGRKGYTVQLQTLPASATTAEVQAAKTAAGSKGAGSVGALKAEDFPGVTAEGYVVYSGVYHKRGEAQRALGSLHAKFPGSRVIEVAAPATAHGGSGAGKSGGKSGGSGSTPKNPAPPSVLEGLSHAKGKNYVEKSKNLPNVVSTG